MKKFFLIIFFNLFLSVSLNANILPKTNKIPNIDRSQWKLIRDSKPNKPLEFVFFSNNSCQVTDGINITNNCDWVQRYNLLEVAIERGSFYGGLYNLELLGQMNLRGLYTSFDNKEKSNITGQAIKIRSWLPVRDKIIVAKKPAYSFSKATLINQIKNAPNPDSKNRLIYYFFAYTSQNDLYYGWANPITMPNGRIKEFYGTAKSINYKTGVINKNCNFTSKQTKTSAPFQGNFDMRCPNNKSQNIVGSWTQDQFNEPGLGSGFNKNGDQVSVFFALQKEILINSINSFNFDGVQEVKKTPQKKPESEKEKPKKKIVTSSNIDNSLITIGSGSGFYINNKGYALTNNHVIDICKQSIAVIDGKETLFRVIATDKTNDVAVLKTNYKSRNFIKINEDGAKLGENVIAVGYPLAGRLSDSVKITRGIVSSLSGLNNNIGQIQIDAALQPGNSGGPVLNENGELVGIASAGLNKLLMAKEAKYIPENVNFAVASPIVVNILKSKKVKYTTPGMFGGSFSNTELAELGDSSTIQLFCRNTRAEYARLKKSKKYSQILLDID